MYIFYHYLECTEGDVRLIDGPSDIEGTLEICHDDLWGLISDSGWSDSDAEVVCRELGYSIISMSICSHLVYTVLTIGGSLALTGSHYGKPNKTIHVGNVRCYGNEENLRQCSKTTYSLKEGQQLQQATDVAGVSCIVAEPDQRPNFNTSTSTSDNSVTVVLLCIVIILIISVR